MNLLLVSPRFPPTNAADSQRIRLLLPQLERLGVTATVLATDPSLSFNEIDPWQLSTLPVSVPVRYVQGLGRQWSRIPGLGSLDSRTHRTLAQEGSHLLQGQRYNLIYFSTTVFGSFRLGPLWKRRHGIPFVLDYQDPWVNDHYRRNPDIRPPGGRLKYSLVDRLQRYHEPRVLRHAAGYTTVSPAYVNQLQARYPFAASVPSLVLPFPGSEEDFQHLQGIAASQLPFDPHDGFIHWVSIGRGGADLHAALRGLFESLALHASSALRNRLRLHFIGTSYAPAGQGIGSIAPLAEEYGLAELVEERMERLPLSLTLATLKRADALLVIGSNDPGYTASKLVPYLLARRPLLAVMHKQSLVCELLDRCGGGQLVRFSSDTTTAELSDLIAANWLANNRHAQLLPLDRSALRPHTSAGQAEQLVAFLRGCL
jgi:hypothetical protein